MTSCSRAQRLSQLMKSTLPSLLSKVHSLCQGPLLGGAQSIGLDKSILTCLYQPWFFLLRNPVLGFFPTSRSVRLLDPLWQDMRSTLVPGRGAWSPYLSFLQWRAQSLPCPSVPKPPSPGTWGGAHGQTGRWLLSGSGLSVGIQLAAVRSNETEMWARRTVFTLLTLWDLDPTPALLSKGEAGRRTLVQRCRCALRAGDSGMSLRPYLL